MSSKLCFWALAALATCALASCKHDADTAPACYSGTVVGFTNCNGLLINVDPAYPIGNPTAGIGTSAPLGDNVVAVINSNEILAAFGNPSGVSIGKKLFFTYVIDPKRRYAGANYILDAVKPDVPNLVFSNVSTTPCGPAAQ